VDYFGYKVPTDEKVPLVIDDVTNPRWSYAASKLLNEVSLFSAMKQITQDILILRYHNIYGPGQTEHFIPDYINRALKGEYRIYGYENTRSFLFIDDAIKITSQLIFSNAKNLVINVGSEEEMTILSVAKTINKILKVNNEIQLNDPPKGSVSRRKPDLTLLRSIIGDFNFTSLVDGLKITVKSATNKS
jgi:nucleoside-diphosphate-sugar epimerase